jgi:predicted O-methyltransferase YrrM
MGKILRDLNSFLIRQRSRPIWSSEGAPMLLRGSSVERVPELITAAETFDLIYVDGSHAKLDVITDALLCWRLLDRAGLMIFDDYRLPEVGLAVDAFVKLVSSQATVMTVARQVFVRYRN